MFRPDVLTTAPSFVVSFRFGSFRSVPFRLVLFLCLATWPDWSQEALRRLEEQRRARRAEQDAAAAERGKSERQRQAEEEERRRRERYACPLLSWPIGPASCARSWGGNELLEGNPALDRRYGQGGSGG